MRKKLVSLVMSLFMVAALFMMSTETVYAANASISVSASSVKIGDSITVTVAVPEGITATIDVTYPSNLVSFTSCSTTANNTGSAISMNLGSFSSRTATITFSAIAAGNAAFTVNPITAGSEETAEEVALGGASANVTIENQASVEQPVELSSNNSLGILQLYEATLSPAFHANTTSYTASVGYDVTKVTVYAVAADSKAKVTSISGGNDLKVGNNNISIVVQAENGVSKTYTIVVTRAQKTQTQPSSTQTPNNSETTNTQTPNSSETTNSEASNGSETSNSETSSTQPAEEKKFSWNGSDLEFIDTIPNSVVPKDFEKSTKVINNKEVPVLDFKNGALTLMYLSDENGENSLYVYDTVTQDVYPFVSIGNDESYIIILRPNDAAVPVGYSACTLSIEGKGVVDAYYFSSKEVSKKEESTIALFGAETFYATEVNLSDFYLIYCMNSKGESGWYQYDSAEQTFQRYAALVSSSSITTDPEFQDEYEALKEDLEDAKQMQFIIIIGAAVVIIILLVIIIVLAVKLGKQTDEEYDDDEDDMFFYDEDESDEDEPRTVFSNLDKIQENETKTEEISEDDEDEIEIEFYEMAEEVVSEETPENEEEEIEIEFYEISEEKSVQEETPENEEEEIEIEFYEMPEVEIKEPNVEPEKHTVIEIADEDIYEEDDDDDSDLEFIELE